MRTHSAVLRTGSWRLSAIYSPYYNHAIFKLSHDGKQLLQRARPELLVGEPPVPRS